MVRPARLERATSWFVGGNGGSSRGVPRVTAGCSVVQPRRVSRRRFGFRRCRGLLASAAVGARRGQEKGKVAPPPDQGGSHGLASACDMAAMMGH